MADLLIVDDDEDVVWMLSEILASSGHSVRVGRNGVEGLRLLKERRPDLVLLDVEMPVLDGPGMAERMFVHNLGIENVPIVLVSGVVNVHELAARVGTPYFLNKPFRIESLTAVIDRVLAERHLPSPMPHPS